MFSVGCYIEQISRNTFLSSYSAYISCDSSIGSLRINLTTFNIFANFNVYNTLYKYVKMKLRNIIIVQTRKVNQKITFMYTIIMIIIMEEERNDIIRDFLYITFNYS